MNNKRKDKKGRNLRSGEIQLADGRYRFKYTDSFGKLHYAYSWRLEHNDPTPMGKKKQPALRDIEKQIQADAFDKIAINGADLTVLELIEKYVETKTAVRPTTKAGYKTVINILKKEKFGKLRIDKVHISDAKLFLIKLQKKDGRGYSSIHTIRGVLRPAFQLAVDDDLIRKNPFDFQLVDVIINDSIRREALSREDQKRFMDFIQNDLYFCKYYDAIFVLLNTGLRISEFCGLTVKDVNLKKGYINVERQLQKRTPNGYYIEKTKTDSGKRQIPMTPEVQECMQRILNNRKAPTVEPMIDGITGFLFFDKNGKVMYALHWEKYMKHIVDKYNNIYRVQLPSITPHVLRHTYCTNMAKSGMNPKTLQYLIGHADISVTLNTYTHVKFDDAKEEVERIILDAKNA